MSNSQIEIEIYELEDFKNDPQLIQNESAVASLLSSLIIQIASENLILYNLLSLTFKNYQDFDLKYPMAVSITDEGSFLKVNPNFFLTFFTSEEQIKTVLYHESLHLSYLHPIFAENKKDPKYQLHWNIAYDAVINQNDFINQQHVVDLKLVSIDMLQHLTKDLSIKPNKDSTYYFNKIKHLEFDQDTENTLVCDDHNEWGNDTSDHHVTQKEQLEALASQLLNASLSDDMKQEIADKLDEALQEQINTSGQTTSFDFSNFSFQQYLQHKGVVYELPTIKSTLTHLLRKNPCRKFSIQAYKHHNGTNIIKKGRKNIKDMAEEAYIFGDTSGSMNIDNVYRIASTFQKKSAKFYTVEFNLFSDHVYPYDGETYHSGGTNIKAIFQYLTENKINKQTKIIIITDGYIERISEQIINGYTNVSWLIVDGGITPEIENPRHTVHFVK